MTNPWLNEHKSTATMKYFLIHVQLIYIELKTFKHRIQSNFRFGLCT